MRCPGFRWDRPEAKPRTPLCAHGRRVCSGAMHPCSSLRSMQWRNSASSLGIVSSSQQACSALPCLPSIVCRFFVCLLCSCLVHDEIHAHEIAMIRVKYHSMSTCSSSDFAITSGELGYLLLPLSVSLLFVPASVCASSLCFALFVFLYHDCD